MYAYMINKRPLTKQTHIYKQLYVYIYIYIYISINREEGKIYRSTHGQTCIHPHKD